MAEDQEYDDWVVEPPHDADEPDSESSTSSEDSSSSGSSNSSSSGGGDDSTTVVVSGDPGSSEEQELVGQGDNLEEAQADAASNPGFDADEGDPVDDVEESLGTDQPEINPDDQQSEKTNVVVTGDPGSSKEQKVVGQGQTLQGAQVQAASNPGFDAAKGTDIDALEQKLGQGQGDGTTIKALQEKRTQSSREKRRQARQDRKNERLTPFKRAKELQVENQILEERKQKAFQESGLSGKSVIAGVELMQRGQEFGQKVSKNTVGRASNTLEDLIEPQVVTDQGEEIIPNEKKEDFFQTDSSELVESQVEGFSEDVADPTVSGFSAGPTQLGGLVIATPGATELAVTNEDTPSLQEGVSKGAELTVEEASENPGDFLLSEAGEEAGEAATGFLVAGPAGAVAGAAPTISPEVTPSVRAKASDVTNSVKEIDLTNTRKGSARPANPLTDSRPKSTPRGRERSRTDPRDERPEPSARGTDRTQELQEFAQSDPRRTEGFGTDVRGEFNTENILETGTATTDTTGTSTQAQETGATGFDLETSTEPSIETTDDVLVDDTPESDIISTPSTEPEVITETKTEPETEPETRPEVKPDIFSEPEPETETKVDPRPELLPEPEPSLDPTPDFEPDEDKNGDDSEGLFAVSTEDTEFQGSVGAEILGVTAEEKPGRLQASDPTNLRPILEDS